MKYGVLSDTHDSFYNLEQVMEVVKEKDINTCFHLGDFCAPVLTKAMTAHKEIQWYCVWGNVDGDKAAILLMEKDNPKFDIVSTWWREMEVEGRKLFLTHYPDLARIAAETGRYDAVFHGQNHLKSVETLEDGTLLANPGEVVGFKTGEPSFGIWDSDANAIEIIDLDDFIVAK